MNGVSASDLHLLLGYLDEVEAAAQAEPDQVQGVVVSRLSSLVPADTVVSTLFDRATKTSWSTSNIPAMAVARNRDRSRWNDLLVQHPVVDYYGRSGDGRAVTLSDFITQQALHRLDLYDEFFRPFDFEYVLSIRVMLSVDRGFDLACSRRSTDFSERDRLVFNLLRHYLGPALREVESRRAADDTAGLLGLTVRESEVLGWVASGRTNAEVAIALSIAPGTVKKHLDNIYEKLGVSRRSRAAARVFESTPHRAELLSRGRG